jgi:nitroreductase
MLTVAEAMRQRRSTRSFKKIPVPDEMILEMLEAARQAPSASNSQPWRYVVVTDAQEKKELRRLCFGQTFIEEAGVVFVVCADLSSYSGSTYKKRRQEAVDAGVLPASTLDNPIYKRIMESTDDPDPTAYVTPATANTYIATEHMVLMAAALGLGSCWVGAISDREAIKRLLGVPEKIMLLGLVAVGYANGTPPYRPKLPLEDILLRPFPAAAGDR